LSQVFYVLVADWHTMLLWLDLGSEEFSEILLATGWQISLCAVVWPSVTGFDHIGYPFNDLAIARKSFVEITTV